MCEQLFTLCDLQLGAIVADLDRSLESVNNAAAKLIQDNSSMAHQSVRVFDAAETKARANELVVDLNQIVMGLQFHDELAQRINHIQVLLKLIQDQSTLVVNPDFNAEKMLTMVSGIFSSSAEFKQLGIVFPEYNAANDTDVAELF